MASSDHLEARQDLARHSLADRFGKGGWTDAEGFGSSVEIGGNRFVIDRADRVQSHQRCFRLLDHFGRLGFAVKDREQHAGDDQRRSPGWAPPRKFRRN